MKYGTSFHIKNVAAKFFRPKGWHIFTDEFIAKIPNLII